MLRRSTWSIIEFIVLCYETRPFEKGMDAATQGAIRIKLGHPDPARQREIGAEAAEFSIRSWLFVHVINHQNFHC